MESYRSNHVQRSGHAASALVVLKMGDDGPVTERGGLTSEATAMAGQGELERIAEGTNDNCPVSNALGAIEIRST